MNNPSYPPGYDDRELDEKNLENKEYDGEEDDNFITVKPVEWKPMAERLEEEYERMSLEGNTDMGLHEIEDVNQIIN